MAKKTTTSKLKKELDRVFSLFIRQRYKNHNETVMCFTCGTKGHWKTMDCGHFQGRANIRTRWSELNCQVQCKRCNIFKNGEQFKFGLYLDQQYGPGTAEELHQQAMRPHKLLQWELQDLIDQYKEKIKELTSDC